MPRKESAFQISGLMIVYCKDRGLFEISYRKRNPNIAIRNIFYSSEFNHLIEVYGFKPDLKTTDICSVLQSAG